MINPSPKALKGSPSPRHELGVRYQRIRQHSERLAAHLTAEDMCAQSMADASPTKWHLGHTSWFYETFLLAPLLPGYTPFDPIFGYLFNSYYEAVGPRQPRPQRGLMTRPGLDQVMAYRQYVDTHMARLLDTALPEHTLALLELGLQHEQQHQELILMDVLHLFSLSPLKPAFDATWPTDPAGRRGRWRHQAGGLVELGHNAEGFAFDNEGPRHKAYVAPFEISDRLVTNGQWLEFMAAGGYTSPGLWLSEGWATVQGQGWQAPLYWQRLPEQPAHSPAGWAQMTLRGLQPLHPDEPVSHLSYYEANAFAQWADARLPTEAEWEVAAAAGLLEQRDDVAWQWTQSAYSAYPGFKAAPSAVGEYNGKFMCNQFVLRGGCQFTPAEHARLTYRNFFPPSARWARSGLRLARDARPANLHPVGTSTALAPHAQFHRDVLAGLAASPKALAPKYFYDAAGSRLFEDICRLPEYYPTRAEMALLGRIMPELAAVIPTDAALVEFGSGASDKTQRLLDAAPQIGAYVPIDISQSAVDGACQALRRRYPRLQLVPVVEDFTHALQLPAALGERPRVGFFPGSTLGNFSHTEAVAFLRGARQLLGRQACFILGVDMLKPLAPLLAAYNDAAGVTAAFNKNLLARINRELGANFDLPAFDHQARWNARHERVEMHLVARTAQTVRIGGQAFHFAAGESLHSENSHKFSVERVMALAAQAGWKVSGQWLSEQPQVGMFVLR
ncbi:ergothioneine biosynthesis protein EgtB [Pseudomonas typographi]|uniref:L-histidine N(Alpha)-methyltransferase n=1 Tax=Pseudomonas typographi TaxID=2715964 RepID=A0ABR7Z5T9_9PSED|nr:ergothioneine biosynthesis protein EgtB [Pseudomonas typographi]MBD1600684.1 L-histidine N(alpha)-methyltransferase [Pseudomonas typographi]